MHDYQAIKKCIENSAYLFSSYILTQLNHQNTLAFIVKIMQESGKEIHEAVSVMISVIKYLSKNRKIFEELEENDSFQEYLNSHRESILQLSISAKNQANLPERAMPLFEVFEQKLGNVPVAVVELGSSFGLIGYCLLNPQKAIANKHLYFSTHQKIPKHCLPIKYYLGIDVNIPDKEWILSCIWEEEDEHRLRRFVDDIQPKENFELVKNNALIFSELEPVKRLLKQSFTLVILTSFMLYQMDKPIQNQFKDSIKVFCQNTGSHWVNQTFRILSDRAEDEYLVEWDGVKILELPDDKCTDWKWI